MMTNTKTPLTNHGAPYADWRKEFPDFPVSAMPDLPNGYADVSWRNDMSPCFSRICGNNEVRIWIDYPDAADREFPEMKQFTVSLTLDHENNNDPVRTVETDNWNIAIETAFLFERYAENQNV